MIDFERLFARDLPVAAGRFGGMPRYNFIGGHNDPEIIPVEALAAAAERVIKREGKQLALYNMGHGPLGHPGLRAFVAAKLKGQRGIDSTAEDVLITSGSNQGIDLVNQVLLETGDTVIVEQATYSAALSRLKARGVRAMGAPLDDEGLKPDRLAAMIEDLRDRGALPKYIYTIPTIQNPTGSVLPLERRRELLRISSLYGVPIFEDECYADLLWEGDWPPALRGMDGGEQVIHIGSFSKCLAPALRLGYVSAPWAVMSRLVACKNDGGTPALEQMTVADYFGSHFEDHVRTLKEGLRRKLGVLTGALEEQFGTSAEFTLPKGGIFLWVRLPEHVDTTALARAALEAGLAFNPGGEWSTHPDVARNYLRLCFALPPPEAIRAGVAELARICHQEYGVPARSANIARG